MKTNTLSALANRAKSAGVTISEIVLDEQVTERQNTRQQVYDQMKKSFLVMMKSVEDGLKPGVRSVSGLTGGDAFLLSQRTKAGKSLCGGGFSMAVAAAVGVAEINASMGCIVAAPTAGSCGIVPAALYTMITQHQVSEEEAVMALFTAAGVGGIIAENASISGATGGCQAECGSAGAMAAALMVELEGGTPDMVCHGAAIALKNMLGLVCDPVAGLVEIPCIKRNGGGIANALCAAELALAGVKSMIPVDEVIVTMKQVGDRMSSEFKETAEGGLAVTPTGLKLAEQVLGKAGK